MGLCYQLDVETEGNKEETDNTPISNLDNECLFPNGLVPLSAQTAASSQ